MAIAKQTGVPINKYVERSALTGWRHSTHFRPGVRKAAKTIFNRRVRHQPFEIEDAVSGMADDQQG